MIVLGCHVRLKNHTRAQKDLDFRALSLVYDARNIFSPFILN